MKTIFVPHDYSGPSLNAARYAVQLAKFFDARIILYHCFQLPVVTGEASFIQYPYDELYNDHVEGLKKLKTELQREQAADLEFEIVAKSGFAGSGIVEEAAERKANLVVMGITGRNRIGEVLIGSNAIYVARHSKIPVMIIPDGVKYKKIRKIAFACDYDHTEEGTLLDDVKLFQFMFDAKLDIVNVFGEEKVPAYEKAATGLAIENSLTHTDHDSFFIRSDDPVEGLNDYLDSHQPDLLIIAPKKHNLFSKMFHESVTKAMAYHSHLPILTLHQE